MNDSILMVTGAPAAAKCAAEIATRLNCAVDLVETRKSAMQALKRQEYSVLLLEDALAESDATQSAALLEQAGTATPVQLNFATTGTDRAVREVRAALVRRRAEMDRAQLAASRLIEAEINSDLTGLLLELDLVLSSRRVPPEEAQHLARAVDLTRELRRKLSQASGRAEPAGTRDVWQVAPMVSVQH